jgi:thiol-disulfide isomerase/thioredoxin
MTKAILMVLGVCLCATGLVANVRAQEVPWTKREDAVFDRIHHLREQPDDVRGRVTKQIAVDIRGLPTKAHRLDLATALASLATEGDFGHDTLQEVATTLAGALREDPPPMMKNQPAEPYVILAQLVRYEHVDLSFESPQFAAAMAKLAADDSDRQNADFTLTDLQGRSWTLQALHGKVVLVNFWATWCGPCRKEMPDLDAVYKRFKDQGLVLLAISDEEVAKVKQLLAEKNVSYPILLDPGRKVNDLFHIEGIPKSFVYDREGKLVAQAIDMRTQKQFLEMLGQAGLH